MSVRATRWVWFLGVWLMAPWPMLLLADAWVPSVRYWLLTLVALAVAVVEGAAGPVPFIVLFFALHALATTAAAFGIGWAVARALAPFSPGTRRLATLLALVLALAAALGLDAYRTPFGTAPYSNLTGVLS